MVGQLQSGAVMAKSKSQPFDPVTVTVMSVPEVIPVIVQMLPEVLVTVPAVAVTVPVLTVTSKSYVNKSIEQVGILDTVIVGVSNISKVTEVLVALVQVDAVSLTLSA